MPRKSGRIYQLVLSSTTLDVDVVVFLTDALNHQNLRNIDNKLSKTQTSHISLHCIPGSAFAGLHIGTNNLESGVWEKDKKDFVQLILSVKGKSISSDYIFVSLILRRWDSGALHEQSIYYNKKLIELSPLYNLKMFYSDNTFILSDTCHASIGLKQGKN